LIEIKVGSLKSKLIASRKEKESRTSFCGTWHQRHTKTQSSSIAKRGARGVCRRVSRSFDVTCLGLEKRAAFDSVFAVQQWDPWQPVASFQWMVPKDTHKRMKCMNGHSVARMWSALCMNQHFEPRRRHRPPTIEPNARHAQARTLNNRMW
jgi:hypothetical protein